MTMQFVPGVNVRNVAFNDRAFKDLECIEQGNRSE